MTLSKLVCKNGGGGGGGGVSHGNKNIFAKNLNFDHPSAFLDLKFRYSNFFNFLVKLSEKIAYMD
jgi:hypothetical protein